MTLNLALASIVNAAGAFLFLLLGLAILLVARRRGLLVGAVCAAFGYTHIVENLVVPDSTAAIILIAAGPCALLPVQLALAYRLSVGLPGPAVGRLRLYAAANAVALGVVAYGILSDPGTVTRVFRLPTVGAAYAEVALISTWSGFSLLVAASVSRAHAETQAAARRAHLMLATAFGLFAMLVSTSIPLVYARPEFAVGPVVLAGLGLQAANAIVLTLFFVPAPGAPDAGRFRRASLALVAVGLFGCALVVPYRGDFGSFGIVRTIGVALLVVAIVKDDLLGVRLPRLAASRGPLAAASLAVLFIVAQVAQNFLSAQYGLILGGIVAGAFLFAAQPIQRAIEARTQAPGPAPAPAPGNDAQRGKRRRELYATAVRAALADHTLTREEERALAHLAEELGIGAGEAHDIRAVAEASLR